MSQVNGRVFGPMENKIDIELNVPQANIIINGAVTDDTHTDNDGD